jgi:salicylate hydroxylase
VLGHLMEKIRHPSQLYDMLVIYEALRKPRTTHVVNLATARRSILHLPDGPLQQERDRQLLEEAPFQGYPNQWGDPTIREYLYAYDPLKEVNEAWSKYLSGIFPCTKGAGNAGCGSIS